MVRLAGLEPATGVFSILLIDVVLCAYLLVLIRAFANSSKHYFASVCNIEKKIVCESVRAFPVVR